MNVAEMLHLVTTIDYSKYQYKSSFCKFLIYSRSHRTTKCGRVTAPAISLEVRSTTSW